MTECLIVFVKLWGASSRLIISLSFVLWVISTVTTQRSGWDHASLMPMVWLLLISPLLLTVLNWLMCPVIGLEVCWILFWRMFRLCDVHVHGNIGRSDHASLWVALNLSPTVAGFDVARRVPLKSRVNWNAVCEALSGLNWRGIFRSPTMVLAFDREISRIMERFVPMVTLRRRGGDAAWFDGDCRRAFELKQSAYHRWYRNLAFSCELGFILPSTRNWAREVERHILDVDPNGGVDTSGCFPMYFRKTASVLAPKLSRLFRRLLRCGEFPLEWRIADVTPIPKGPLSALVCNYRADFDYTSSVEGYWEVDLFAFWTLFGEIWSPVISPVLMQKEFGFLWCSSGHRRCWSVRIRQVESLRSSRLISVRPLTGLNLLTYPHAEASATYPLLFFQQLLQKA